MWNKTLQSLHGKSTSSATFIADTSDSDHEAQEQDHARTHATRYNLRENPKPKIYHDYFMLERSQKPALASLLLVQNN